MDDHAPIGAEDGLQLAVSVTALRSLTMPAAGHLAAGGPDMAVALLRAGGTVPYGADDHTPLAARCAAATTVVSPPEPR